MPEDAVERRTSRADAGALEMIAKGERDRVASRTVYGALLDGDDTPAATLVVTHYQPASCWRRRKDEGDLVPEAIRGFRLTLNREEQWLAGRREEGTKEAPERRLLPRELVGIRQVQQAAPAADTSMAAVHGYLALGYVVATVGLRVRRRLG